MELKWKLSAAEAEAINTTQEAINFMNRLDFVAATISRKHFFTWNGAEMLEVKDPNWGTPYPARGMNNSVTTYSPESWAVIGTKGKYSLVVTFRQMKRKL